MKDTDFPNFRGNILGGETVIRRDLFKKNLFFSKRKNTINILVGRERGSGEREKLYVVMYLSPIDILKK